MIFLFQIFGDFVMEFFDQNPISQVRDCVVASSNLDP